MAKDTVVLLLESNPDIGQLLEWVIDRCYTAQPREADACFLSLAAIFCARYVHLRFVCSVRTYRRKIEYKKQINDHIHRSVAESVFR